MKWFRLYDELVDDPKVLLLSLELRWALIALWCVASQNDGRLPSLDAMALKLRVKPAKMRQLLAALEKSGFIDKDDDGLLPHAWGKRQFKTDKIDPTNSARQERYRNSHRNGPVTGGRNGKRNAKDRYGGVTVKRPESETESDSDPGDHQHPPETVAAPAKAQSLIRPEAHAIAEELWQVAGFSKETLPPGWCGAAMAIQKWLNDGCPGDVVKLAVNAALRRKRDGPPHNFSYFAQPIAAAFADHQRPNPTAPPQAFDGKTNGHAPQKRTVIDAGKDLIAKLNALESPADIGSGAGDPPPRLLPPH